MADTLGKIPVPEPPIISATFPLNPPFGTNVNLPSRMAVHTFYTGDAKTEQRFYLGPGAREWKWTQEADETERTAVRDFWEQLQGSYALFTFNAPNPDGTTTATTVRFATEPLVFSYTQGMLSQIQIHLIEVLTAAAIDAAQPGDPHYAQFPLYSTLTRFPDSTFADALGAQAQTLIPLVKIQPLDPTYPAMYVSDRRCYVGGQLYQARFIGHKGIGQSAVGLPNITGQSDQVTLTFGNADRVMRMIANETNLEYASVQFSIYHVASATKLDFWAGQVLPQGYQIDTSPQFELNCSDPLSSPFLTCPPRIVDHNCNAKYDDGIECQFAAHGALDLVNFPSADASKCDHSFDGPNGCLAHQMKYWYRGVFAVPEGVRVKDDTTGFYGIARHWITSVSLINDSVWGTPIPIIVTDVELIVPAATGVVSTPLCKALILAGRNESGFYEAVGIVGEGPMQLGQDATLDGSYHANWPNPGENIRLIPGNVPANLGGNVVAQLSLDELGDQTNNPINTQPTANSAGLPSWRWIWVESTAFPGDHKQGYTALDAYTSGVAAIAIRISYAQGLQLTTLDQHDMEADVITGWQGWTWTGPGARSATQVPMTNPIWLCVNLWLFCNRVKDAPAATQEQYFDVARAVAAAAVCNTVVDRIVETWEGQGIQFKFIGQIRDARPLRDWFNDILTNCLGFFWFNFGKLSFGIRDNATPVSAYTDGNIVFRTLQATGIGPQFTKLVMNFADYEYSWQPNNASYQDDDYAAWLGGGARALHKIASMNLSGTADIDQATRLCITRAREEIGGITQAEWDAARRVTFKTTILGLDTAPGDVISVSDPELPGKSVLARVETYALNPDWSVTITARGVTDSMYDFTVGPIPAAAKPGPIRPQPYKAPSEAAWMPNWVTGSPGDPIYGSQDDYTFGMVEDISIRSDNSLAVYLTISGYQPLNNPLAATSAPLIGFMDTQTTGGFFPGDTNVFVAIGLSSALGYSKTSNTVAYYVPAGTDTNQMTLHKIVLPSPQAGDAWTTLTLYAALDDPRLMTSQAKYTGPPSMIAADGSWVIAGNYAGLPLDRARANPPAPNYDGLIIRVKYVYHSGTVGMPVTDVQTGAIFCNGLAPGADDWGGRVVSILAGPLGTDAQVWNFKCSAYDHTQGKFTVTPDPVTVGVEIGSVLVVRYAADTVTPTTIGDSGIDNSIYPGGQTDQIQNAQIRIIEGPGRKQIRNIVSNTGTVYTIDVPWAEQPDATSLWIVEARDWMYRSEVTISANRQDSPLQVKLEVDNLDLETVLVGAFLVDATGVETADELIPVRDTYLMGAGQGLAPQTVTADYTVGPNDQVIFVDTSARNITITAPDPTAAKGMQHAVVIKKKSTTANTNSVTITSPALIDGATGFTLTDEGQAATILPTNLPGKTYHYGRRR